MSRSIGRGRSAGARLRIRLKHQGAVVGQALGRFRLSVTSSNTPQRVVEIPARLRPILAIAAADRTEQQRKDLAAFYRTVAVSLKPARDRIAELQKELRALGIPTALVMRERVALRAAVGVRAAPRQLHGQGRAGLRRRAGGAAIRLRDDQMPNRLGLARWLVDEENPLTARVAVNRAWEQFFGRGIVETSEDFGTQGTPPSHPELLDWLATELVRQGWRTKALHKLIVTSATYRQSSAAPPALVERDPYNRLLARGPRFRMEAEMVRDAALAASGLLSRKIGGPSVFPPQPDGIWDIPYSSEKWIAERRGGPLPPRALRVHPPLGRLPELHDVRCHEPGAQHGAAGAHEHAAAGAHHAERRGVLRGGRGARGARVARDAPAAGPREHGRATYAFRLVATRTPKPDEVERIVASYTRQLERFRKDPEAAARAIKGYAVAGVDPAEQAAWTLVANALLNLDEALTKQ